jgi:spore maturation protein CgeB
MSFGGWIANADAPRAFAQHRVTVHVPRRPYVAALPGIPTIRPFEAMACGIPLISAPWDDCEGLFRAGTDHLVANDGTVMQRHLRAVLADPALAGRLRREGLKTIRDRHTCRHRVDELFGIIETLRPARTGQRTEAAE